MLTNIAKSFPEKSAADYERIARASIDNLGKAAIALMRLPSILKVPPEKWIQEEGYHYVEEAFQQGKGIISITAHIGCWELMAGYLMKYHPKFSAVYRALDNPRVDAYVKNQRTCDGGTLIERHDILRQAPRWLKQNGLIGFLVDQNFPGGVFVDFFGRPAATTPFLSMLARRTGAALLHVHTRWEGDMLRVIWGKAPPLSTNPDKTAAIAEDTLAMNKIVEGWVRETPGQWFWLHNRWKKQPETGGKVFTLPPATPSEPGR